MDEKAFEALAKHEEMRDEHFASGYYSEAVRAEAQAILALSKKEKYARFAEIYDAVYQTAYGMIAAYAAAEGLDAIRRYQDGVFDLTDERLGKVVARSDMVELAGKSFKSLEIYSLDFNPEPRTIQLPENVLGIDYESTHASPRERPPKNWRQPIYAKDDDSGFIDLGGRFDFKDELVRLLDAEETLNVVLERLNLPPVPRVEAGQ